MKKMLMMIPIVMFQSMGFAQYAMQSQEIVAHMALIDDAASFLPSGDHLGKKSAASLLPNCTVTVAPTNDNGGGLLASMRSTSLLDILGTNDKSMASIEIYYSDVLTEDSKVTADEAVIGYLAENSEGVSKTLRMKMVSKNKADVTISELAHGKVIKSASCRVKLND